MKTTLARIGKFIPVMVLVSLLVGAAALAFPADAVYAQGTNPPVTPTAPAGQAQPQAQNQQQQAANVEKRYQAEQQQLTAQEKRFTAADGRIQKVEDRIAGLKGQGKDVTALEQALSNFKADVQASRAAHDAAASILKTHAGFDANGKVTDLVQARLTVQQAGQQLRDVRQDLRPAVRDLVRAIRDFMRDNRKK